MSTAELDVAGLTRLFPFQFFCCMLIVLTAEIAAGVWSYQNSDKLEAFVKSNFKYTLNNEYKVIESRTEIVDTIQIHFQCCGVDGPSDWSNTKYNNVNQKGGLIDLALSSVKLNYAVPPSCCKNDTSPATCETSRKGAITTSINPHINKVVSFDRQHSAPDHLALTHSHRFRVAWNESYPK